MKSRKEIEMDFLKAVSNAQELEELSKELSEIASQNISDVFGFLACTWHGDNAQLLRYKGEALKNEMLETADNLNKVAKSIKSTANIIYTAEKAAIQLGM